MSVSAINANIEQHLKLVDELSTAAEYIDACKERADVYRVSHHVDTSAMLFGTYSICVLTHHLKHKYMHICMRLSSHRHFVGMLRYTIDIV
jgi:hypothetical protein